MARFVVQKPARGVVSIIAITVLFLATLFVISQTVLMNGNKAATNVQYHDGLSAFVLAENGGDISNAILTQNIDDYSAFATSCNALRDATVPVTMDVGTYRTSAGSLPALPASFTASSPLVCSYKVTGNKNQAHRTIERRVQLKIEMGTAKMGSSPRMVFKNTYATDAMAIFNLAWLVKKNSLGTNMPNAAIASCVTNCDESWPALTSSSGTGGVGSLGVRTRMAAGQVIAVEQKITDTTRTGAPLSADYSEVGMLFGLTAAGAASPTDPYAGKYAVTGDTTNPSSSVSTTGQVLNGGEAVSGGWCTGANTLVFSLSGTATNYTAQYSSMRFRTNDDPNNGDPSTFPSFPMSRGNHFPLTDGSTEGASGIVFSEVFYLTNPWFVRSGVKSDTKTIGQGKNQQTVPADAVTTPGGLTGYVMNITGSQSDTSAVTVGAVVAVSSGTGALPVGTKVIEVASTNRFYVDKQPTAILDGANVCAGICALFKNPADTSANNYTKFKFVNSAQVEGQWAGGFTCLRNVDPIKIQAITVNTPKYNFWHEVVSGE